MYNENVTPVTTMVTDASIAVRVFHFSVAKPRFRFRCKAIFDFPEPKLGSESEELRAFFTSESRLCLFIMNVVEYSIMVSVFDNRHASGINIDNTIGTLLRFSRVVAPKFKNK